LLVLLFGVFLLFRSGGPAKESATAQPVRAPAVVPAPRVVITSTPSSPAVAAPAEQPGSKAAENTAKTKRTKPAVDPSVAPTGPFENTKASSPRPRPRPKAERRIITDI
jgi:hypothetical protein